jgi:hypothetical protein
VTRASARCRCETLASVRSRAKGESGTFVRSTSGLRSRLRSASPSRPVLYQLIVPTGDPALGFVLFQGCGHVLRATAWARPNLGQAGADHQPPVRSRRAHILAACRPIRSWASNAPSRSIRPAERPPCGIECHGALPSAIRPALQRLRGADALPHAPELTCPSGAAPCLRFCTVRELRQK